MKKKDKEELYCWLSAGGVVAVALYFYINPLHSSLTLHSGCDICIDSDNTNPYLKGTVTCINIPTNRTIIETDYCSAGYLHEMECRSVSGRDDYDLYQNEILPQGRTCVDGRYLHIGETTTTSTTLKPTTTTTHIITTTSTTHPTTTTTQCLNCNPNPPNNWLPLTIITLIITLFAYILVYNKK